MEISDFFLNKQTEKFQNPDVTQGIFFTAILKQLEEIREPSVLLYVNILWTQRKSVIYPQWFINSTFGLLLDFEMCGLEQIILTWEAYPFDTAQNRFY